jgi:hypothetical protein
MDAMYRVWVLAAALCAGCFSKPGFSGGGGDGDGGIDGNIDSGTGSMPCTGTTWPSPVNVMGLDNQVTGEPTITGDLKEIYWSHQSAGWKIEWAKRTLVTSGFTTQGVVAFDPGAAIDQDPSITDDGLMMIYRVGLDEPDARMKQVTRLNRVPGTPWSAPIDVPGLAAATVTSLDLSGDGLTLYYTRGLTLHFATRNTRMDMFTEQPQILGAGIVFPAISGDELSLYYMSNNLIHVATRGDKLSAFGTGMPVFNDPKLKDADITADGKTMVIATDNSYTIAISQRTCP